MYIRLLIESQILSSFMIKQLGLLGVISNCWDALKPDHLQNAPLSDELGVLKGALAAIQELVSNADEVKDSTKVLRSRVPEGEDAAAVLEDYFSRMRCALSHTYTYISMLITHSFQSI
jgi:hypothetical protein